MAPLYEDVDDSGLVGGLSFFIKEIIGSEKEGVPKFVAVNRQEYKLKIKLWQNKENCLTKKKASDNIEKYDSGALCSFLCCWKTCLVFEWLKRAAAVGKGLVPVPESWSGLRFIMLISQ